MPLLIDAFNVLHTTGVLPPEQAGIDVDDLIGLLAVSRYQRQAITLVCDGSGRDVEDPGCCGGVEVRYSGSGRPADDLIIDRINRDSAPRQLLVVSSDQEIVRAARRRKCRTLRSDTLLHQLAADLDRAAHPKPGPGRPNVIAPLPRSEVQRWIEAFELGDPAEELAAAEPPADASPFPPGPPPPDADPHAGGATAEPSSAPDAQPDAPAEEHGIDPRAALPGELIAEAEALAEHEPEVTASAPSHPGGADDSTQRPAPPERRTRSRQSDVDADEQDPMAELAKQYSDADTGRRTARRLSRKQLSELSDEELDAIDMQHLLSDVAPIDHTPEHDDDDETDQTSRAQD